MIATMATKLWSATYSLCSDGLVDRRADAGDTEDDLDDEGATDERAHVEPGNGEQREAGGSERMAEEHPSGGDALRLGHGDEVFLQGGDHVATQEPLVHRDLSERQHHCGQHRRTDVVGDRIGHTRPTADRGTSRDRWRTTV